MLKKSLLVTQLTLLIHCYSKINLFKKEMQLLINNLNITKNTFDIVSKVFFDYLFKLFIKTNFFYFFSCFICSNIIIKIIFFYHIFIHYFAHIINFILI